MIDFVTASQNMPFSVALAVMFGIAVLEGVATLLGVGFSHLLDALLPDLDIDLHIHADVDASELPAATGLSKFLSWLRVGQVPVLILLVVFLMTFGLLGLGIQALVSNTLGLLLPGLVASTAALFISLPVVRIVGGGLERVMPKDETEAVSEASLVGRIATITIGKAEKGSPAEAKVKDQHGMTHYIMLEPDDEGITMHSGNQVLLVRYETNIYKAIENTNTVLVED